MLSAELGAGPFERMDEAGPGLAVANPDGMDGRFLLGCGVVRQGAGERHAVVDHHGSKVCRRKATIIDICSTVSTEELSLLRTL